MTLLLRSLLGTPACLSYDTTTPDGNGTLCTRTARNPDLPHQRPEERRAAPHQMQTGLPHPRHWPAGKPQDATH